MTARLDQLRNMRARINLAIAAEEAAEKRAALLARQACVVMRGVSLPALPRPSKAMITDAVDACAVHFNVPAEDIPGARRVRPVVQARSVVCWLLREGGLSYPEIAHAVRLGDHTSALHGVRRVAASAQLRDDALQVKAALLVKWGG